MARLHSGPLLMMALLASPATVLASVYTTVQASGLGLVIDGDEAAAYQEAKNQALRQAVEQAVGTLVASHTRVQNFSVIEDHILTRTAGYVRQYRIVQRGPAAGQMYRVALEAEVDLNDLQRQLDSIGLLAADIGTPRLLCRGPAIALADGDSLDGAALLAERLLALGEDLLVVDVGQEGDIVLEVEGQVRPLQAVGIPFSSESLEELGLHSVTARLGVVARWIDNGRSIGRFGHSVNATDVAYGPAADKALATAADQVVTELAQRLADHWRRMLYDGRQIQLSVDGHADHLRLFERDFVQRIGGISALQPRRLSPHRGEYEARSTLAAYRLARQLSAKGLDGLDIEILDVSFNGLALRLQGAP